MIYGCLLPIGGVGMPATQLISSQRSFMTGSWRPIAVIDDADMKDWIAAKAGTDQRLLSGSSVLNFGMPVSRHSSPPARCPNRKYTWRN